MAIFISLWRWRRRSNFRLYCKASDKIIDSQEKVVKYTYDCGRLSANLYMNINKQKEKTMTFEEILPGLKAKKKYVRTGWGGAENYVQLFDTIEQNGGALEVTPYFLINVSGEGEGFSMWSPTPGDVLATDWVEVND